MKLLPALLGVFFTIGSASADDFLVPAIDGPWTQIAGNPDLGELTSPNQQPVDFAVWQAADGTWQAWSCIRKTKCGGHTRLFFRWEGKTLTSPDWKPMGIAMQSDPEFGEDAGGLQAPHVIREHGRYHMFYGDWNHICHAVSDDGKTFERVIQPSGTTALFSEAPGANTRDIMMLKVDDLWYGYYTAFPNGQGAVYLRTTVDFKTWSESTTVAFGGLTGTSFTSAECPHVVRHGDQYYLFRTQLYGPNNITTVYHSTDPAMFGINQDRRYLANRLPVAAPEIVQHDGQEYIVALNPNLDGLRIARLKWETQAQTGSPVFDFENAKHRAEWKIESGDLPGPFTTSTRTQFSPPQRHFISTAELPDRKFDDDRTGVIQSPEFPIEHERYIVYLSGGNDTRTLYVALVDAATGKELVRTSTATDSNQLQPLTIDTSHAVGRTAFVRIVDQATGGWGHLNFGGLYTVK